MGEVHPEHASTSEREGAVPPAEALGFSTSGERLHAYASFVHVPVPLAVLVGRELRIEVATPSMCRLLGRDALVGMTLREAFTEAHAEESLAAVERVYERGESVRVAEVGAVIPRRGVRETALFELVAQALREAQGPTSAVVLVLTEVTEQVRARRRFDALREEAEHASRAKDEFLAVLGHELRNPLAPIVTALQLLRSRGTSARTREHEVIERQVRHVVRLVDDLLDVSRITSGKVELDRRPLEIADVVASAIEVAAPLFEQRHHCLGVDVARGLVVDADPTRLAQVVSNLLTNAAKYTPAGGNVSIAASRADASIVLRVRDDGAGISPAILPHVFDLFVQDRQSLESSMGGLGLGLAIVRSLVELHGGQVEAHSKGLGRGSELVVTLPARSGDLPSDPSEPPPRAAPATRSGRARRVLVIDDNEEAAEMLGAWLAETGYEVLVVNDGAGALAVACDFLPHVILLDIGLPVMDGYEIARRLRERGALVSAKLIAVTGYGQRVDRARSAHAGFDAHLVKPVDLVVVRELLGDP